MNRLGVLTIGVMILCVAVAQAQTESPPANDARTYDMTDFCPASAEHVRYMPDRALTQRINGHVVLDCALNNERKLTTCQIAEETPPRIGFGTAALNIACHNAAIERGVAIGEAAHGLYTAEDGSMRARIPINFNVEGAGSGPGEHGSIMRDRN